ncbi:MAG: DUF1385 domain-containing protein [Capsulimonadaceae bacterium]|nr:DUF1385 domain-containing protein [Capsulimonadaceae bacterium]
MGDIQSSTVKERQMYGGQAVVEGVMMRSPRYFAVACRRESDGQIVVERENVESVTRSMQWMNKPFLRGVLALVDALYMGTRALFYSANVQAADIGTEGIPEAQGKQAPGSQPINGIVIGSTVFISLALGIGLFWVLPTLITEGAQRLLHLSAASHEGQFLANLSDGLIRIVFFLAYVGLISRLPNVRRVFQYHGAEHKAINTLEAGQDLTLENARKASRIHPRCGTNFIFVVLIVSIFVIALFGRPPVLIRIPINLGCVLLVVGISYEILKFAGKYRDQWWAKLLIAPGLATQYLTTRLPDDTMIEVALAALSSVWDKEHEPATEAEAEQAAETPPEPASSIA